MKIPLYNTICMKKWINWILIAGIGIAGIQNVQAEDEISLHCDHAVLMDTGSGAVLKEVNAEEAYSSGSMDRLMTVYAGSTLDTQEVSYSPSSDTSFTYSVPLSEGTYSLQDMLEAVFLGNEQDCAWSIGKVKNFDSVRTQAVQDLGLTGSAFVNSEGKTQDGQYVTAKDMGLLASAFTKKDSLKALYSTDTYAAEFMSFSREAIEYDGLIGFYDGLEEDGSYSCTMSAERNGVQLTAVVLKEDSKETAHSDLIQLLDYGFANYKSIRFSKEDIGSKTVGDVTFSLQENISLLMPVSIEESEIQYSIEVLDEDSKKNIRAYVVFYRNNEEIGRVAMDKTVQDTKEKSMAEKCRDAFDYACLGIAAMLVLIFVLKHGSAFIKPEGE